MHDKAVKFDQWEEQAIFHIKAINAKTKNEDNANASTILSLQFICKREGTKNNSCSEVHKAIVANPNS